MAATALPPAKRKQIRSKWDFFATELGLSLSLYAGEKSKGGKHFVPGMGERQPPSFGGFSILKDT